VLPPAIIGLIYLIVVAFDLSQRLLPGYRTLFGFVAAVAIAISARGLTGWSVREAIEVALWAAAAATCAKLTAGWLKRKAGVDRFGKWLPQGGILDRFDGMLYAAPVALVILGH
jgi:CDP-diglyceride synthetase